MLNTSHLKAMATDSPAKISGVVWVSAFTKPFHVVNGWISR